MTMPKLSNYISKNIDCILAEWEKFAMDIIPVNLSPEKARDHAMGMLRAIVADIEHAQTPGEQSEKSQGLAPENEVEGNYRRWNNQLNRLTGLTDRDLQSRTWLLTIRQEDRTRAAATMKKAIANGYAQAELQMITHDQGVRYYFINFRRFVAGDVALQSVTATSQQALRDLDILGRIGGEEFAVLLPEANAVQSLEVAERLRTAVSATEIPIEGGKVVDHELREYELALVHGNFCGFPPKNPKSDFRRSNRDQTKTPNFSSKSLTYDASM